MIKLLYLILFICMLMPVGLKNASSDENKTLKVMTAIPPVAYVVERIGGSRLKVDVLLGPGKEPHTFDPTPKQISSLAEADIYFSTGFPFEQRLLKKIKNQNRYFHFVETDRGIDKIYILEHPNDLHASPEEKLTTEPDPHIWLSPLNLKIIAINIYNAISVTDPQNRNLYQNNLEKLLQDIEVVHKKLENTFSPYRGKVFFVFHPAFSYFAEAYGLKQIPIEVKGKTPTPRQIEELIKVAREKNIGAVFISPQFHRPSAKIIADALGVPLLVIDPLKKDIIRNLIEVGEKIELSFKSQN